MDYDLELSIFNNNKEIAVIAKKYCNENNLSIISNINVSDQYTKYIIAADAQDVDDYDIFDVIKFKPLTYINFHLIKQNIV